MTLAEDAEAIAAAFRAAGVNTTVDPRKAVSDGKPIILVPPPSVDYVRWEVTWDLVVCGCGNEANLDTFTQLTTLVEEALAAVTPYSIESARPGSYPLISGQPPTPAYFLRLVTT